MRLAVAQYPITQFTSWSEYQLHSECWVSKAIEQQAELLVFPEYGSMELTSLLSKKVQRDLKEQIVALQEYVDAYKKLYSDLAERYGVWILAASIPVKVGSGFRNTAFFFGPDGSINQQQKLVMTRFEREVWNIEAGRTAEVFNTPFGCIGINICYDVEFPLIARKQVEAGADLLLVPSCTDTIAGYHRVKIGAQARALENQCFVAQSVTVGDALWSPAVDENKGAAGVYSPPDYGLPDTGVIQLGELNAAGWQVANLDLEKIAWVRKHGQVFNHRDWVDQLTII